MDFAETRTIELPGGDMLEVQMTEIFIDKLVLYYGLDSKDDLTDNHVRLFMWGSLNSLAKKKESK